MCREGRTNGNATSWHVRDVRRSQATLHLTPRETQSSRAWQLLVGRARLLSINENARCARKLKRRHAGFSSRHACRDNMT
eukprot:scaffold89637_cov27-Tisochrysis_lutea.AAC.1